ncbi:MAG TPA: hypothetical protein VHO70_15290, partial [Chitinispirillaceae bacterium]|nr:hypothetical protein [Chitinispirillaceae bacterium]
NVDSMHIVKGCNNVYDQYSSLSGQSRLGLWHFYQYDHLGGTFTAIGQPDKALEIHKWDYEWYHQASPAFVFWQDLWNMNDCYRSYGTAPTVWRSLFQFSGMLVDNANNRVWIRPTIPTSMNKILKDVPVVNPNGWGTLNYTEEKVSTSAGDRVQSIHLTFDSVVTVKEIVLKNNTTVADPGIIIWDNNRSIVEGATKTLEGSGFEKNIRIKLASPLQISQSGLRIKVYNGAVPTEDLPVQQKIKRAGASLSLTGSQIARGSNISFSVPVSGGIKLDLFQANGAKIGTIANVSVPAGANNVFWNGTTVHGAKVTTSVAILRLTCSSGSISKMVYVK